MLLENRNILINKLKFNLTFEDGTIKEVELKVNDIADVTYNNNGKKDQIVGRVTKIGYNFNSSIGRVESSAYVIIDGSDVYAGKVAFVDPDKILDLNIVESSNTTVNVVTSVSNDEQRIILIREDELGDLSYTKDGTTWKAIRPNGQQGLSAYEVAVVLGFEGTEQEWLNSLNGTDGESAYELAVQTGYDGTLNEWLSSLKGEPGQNLSPKWVFTSEKQMRDCINLIGEGDICAVTDESQVGKFYIKMSNPSPITPVQSRALFAAEPDPLHFFSVVSEGPTGPQGPKGDMGDRGYSAYELAVQNGYDGTLEQWLVSLKGERGPQGLSAYEVAVAAGFVGTVEEWLDSLKGAGIAEQIDAINARIDALDTKVTNVIKNIFVPVDPTPTPEPNPEQTT